MLNGKINYESGIKAFEQWSGARIELNQHVEASQWYLDSEFGVQSLSVAEGVRLRICVEQSLEALGYSMTDAKQKEIFNVFKEAAYRWISNTYGVTLEYLDPEVFQRREVTREFEEWLRIERENSHLL